MPRRHHLLLGGQRSGKSRRAEQMAAGWLARPGHDAVMIATALPNDEEMQARIERHRRDRAERVPRMRTIEVPEDLAAALRLHSRPDCLVLVDCLTLWLTNLTMPLRGPAASTEVVEAACDDLANALCEATGRVVLVSNEIGLGVTPMSVEARRFVDELGRLHQALAELCSDVTLMVAGIEVPVKRSVL
jgi:adenosylcobinamide kinase/adenosylcobinamide-phosphate guanylyltransferase